MSEIVEQLDLPLFPLHEVLFPEGRLSLRIFESRYLDMVSDCMKREQPFGVVLISQGGETGEAAECHDFGTLAHISDWDRQMDGLLEISCVGGRRFQVLSQQVSDDQLILARVGLLPPCPHLPLRAEYGPLVLLLRELLQRAGRADIDQERFDDAGWVSCRLLELLPLSLAQKQNFLQMDDPLLRLTRLLRQLNMLQ